MIFISFCYDKIKLGDSVRELQKPIINENTQCGKLNLNMIIVIVTETEGTLWTEKCFYI